RPPGFSPFRIAPASSL
uniref:Bradykinin RL-16-1 n=3 Tax=Ranidae TaxID=8397 RepID=BRK1_PELRI|nr:RecName: Full=Bradykinin RL-16-1; Contains: RecName: Full=Bradykinin RS-14; AltName: Full=Bradykinin RS-14-2; Contains: RecName: Full=Bradykinin RA-11; AltName: Full=Bradykinin RA-11-2; Contains: RecName: Full=Bradykinin RI-10; Contains: RecName: Full=Bradykinin [Pelophylax ridibundus]